MDSVAPRHSSWIGKLSSFMKALLPKPWRIARQPKFAANVVAILSGGTDRQLIESAARESDLPLRVIERFDSVLPGSDFAVPSVVLFDRGLPASDWRSAFMSFKNCYPRPYMILLSSKSDLNLWDELHRVGGSDILRTPLTRERLVWALDRACSIWQHRQELRRPLEYRFQA